MYKDNIYYIDDDVIYGDTSKIDKKYVMSKDTCDIGYKLKNKDGKVVIDKCMYAYKVLFDNAILGINNDINFIFKQEAFTQVSPTAMSCGAVRRQGSDPHICGPGIGRELELRLNP